MFISIAGAAAAFGSFVLVVGMWSFWITSDASPPWSRRLWFLVLLVGLHYGALSYFAGVYIPRMYRTIGERMEKGDG
jgi:hypothetical protein